MVAQGLQKVAVHKVLLAVQETEAPREAAVAAQGQLVLLTHQGQELVRQLLLVEQLLQQLRAVVRHLAVRLARVELHLEIVVRRILARALLVVVARLAVVQELLT